MAVTRHDLEIAIRNLTTGEFTVDQVVTIARHNGRAALQVVDNALFELLLKAPLLKGSPAWRLAEVSWKLSGEKCIPNLFTAGYPDKNADFLAEKLQTEPNAFSDRNLDFIIHQGWDKRGFAKEAQASRVAQKAVQLKSQSVELAGDIAEVKRRVSEYNFGSDLNALLEKVEEGLLKAGDPFDQAAHLKHLRTFFEKLHQQVGEKLRADKPATVDGTDLTKCGQAIDYLQRKSVLKEKMRDLGRALYGILSNEGVHAIKSEKEYVRLCRNMVAEYALVLLFELERRIQSA